MFSRVCAGTSTWLVVLKHEVQHKEWKDGAGKVVSTQAPHLAVGSPALSCCMLPIQAVTSLVSAASLWTPGPGPSFSSHCNSRGPPTTAASRSYPWASQLIADISLYSVIVLRAYSKVQGSLLCALALLVTYWSTDSMHFQASISLLSFK